MPNQPGTLEQLVTFLAGLFAPLEQRIQDGAILELFAELGIDFPQSLADDPSFANGLADIVALATGLPDKVAALTAAIEAEDYGHALNLSLDIIETVQELVVDFDNVASAIDAKKGDFGGLTPAEVEAFAAELPQRLFDYLVIRQVEVGLPSMAAALDFAGIFRRTEENVGSTNPLKPPYTRRELELGTIPDFLESPADILETLYGWGSPGFDGRDLLQKLEKLALALNLPALYTDAPTPTLDLLFLEITPRTDLSPPGLSARLHTVLKAADSLTLGGEEWEFVFAAGVQAPVESMLVLQPDGTFTIEPPSGQIEGEASVTFNTKRPAGADTYVLLGEADASRLEFEDFTASAGATLTWDPGAGEAAGALSIDGAVTGGRLVIDLSGADGFIGEIMGAVSFAAEFDLAMGLSTDEGFYFRGSSALEIQLPIHIDLALVELQALTISIGIDPAGIPIGLGADIKANLGPLVAVVENMGVRATFEFADDRDGNLGPVDLGFDFKPPNGVGLSLDTGVVKGGGYLFFDYENEEYAGALELSIAEIVTVKAIGLVTTRLPDGSKGFSLLIIISAEFQPIQLGFGFTLNGLGGLLGLNRTMRLEALAEGVRTGSIESVMFPQDVVENAPRIISDLKAFFPPEQGIFLIGPMAKIGWGTPTLVTVSLGVVIEIPPGNIAILGVLKVALPDEDAELLVLQVNFIGALEVDKERLWFFASMFDSRVLFITLEGEMGLLIAWGEDANFVVSVGGFHPTFNPPPLPFPSPKRIALSILNEDFARIRVEGYFAVTSNTAQFGAAVELFFGLDAFKIEGHLGFDALFQFSPFYFIISFSCSLSVKVFGVGLFSVRMRGQLEGTSPWHVEGEGSISVLFFSIDVPFSHTWGQEEETTLPPIEVLPRLQAELEKVENWTASIPAANQLLVSLREIEPLQDVVLHPVGTLRISQRAVPLDLVLEKYGSQKPSDVETLTLAVSDADLAKLRDTDESFATAQFKELNDSKKLSTPAYEPQHAGLELSVAGDQLRTDRAVRRTVRYETEIIDTNFKRFVQRFVGVVTRLFDHLLYGNAAAKSSLSARTQKQRLPIDLAVEVQAPTYVVASMADNSAVDGAAGFTSRAKAEDYMRAQVQGDPALAEELHVIPITESRQAA